MVYSGEYSVGLRELRHHTGAVLARVQGGQTLDVTQYGRVIARIVPVADLEPRGRLAELVESGRARPAARPGYRPPMLPGDGTDSLSRALSELRDAETW